MDEAELDKSIELRRRLEMASDDVLDFELSPVVVRAEVTDPLELGRPTELLLTGLP